MVEQSVRGAAWAAVGSWGGDLIVQWSIVLRVCIGGLHSGLQVLHRGIALGFASIALKFASVALRFALKFIEEKVKLELHWTQSCWMRIQWRTEMYSLISDFLDSTNAMDVSLTKVKCTVEKCIFLLQYQQWRFKPKGQMDPFKIDPMRPNNYQRYLKWGNFGPVLISCFGTSNFFSINWSSTLQDRFDNTSNLFFF